MPLLPPPPDPILTEVDAFRKVMEEQVRDLASSLQRQAQKRRQDLIRQLSQDFRRLRTFESEREWIGAVLDAMSPFCFRSVFFTVLAGRLEWRAARQVEVKPGTVVPLAEAPAFAAAVASGEVTVALKSSGELSKALAAMLGDEPGERVALVPVVANGRTAAILYAEDADPAGIELVAVMAGSALAAHQLKNKASDTGLLQIAPAEPTGLSQEDEELDLRAQRFARLRVSEIRLYEPTAVQDGRRNKNLYQVLQTRIDDAREAYRNQFAADPSTMVDHLDRELIRTLAQGERELMGSDYPGPIV
jgi:hypothetical protein